MHLRDVYVNYEHDLKVGIVSHESILSSTVLYPRARCKKIN